MILFLPILKLLNNSYPILFITIAGIFWTSCSPFSKLATDTRIASESGYVHVSNPAAGIKTTTFGDFKFATTKKQFRELSDSKPGFRNILFYAKTFEPPYEYYFLINPKVKTGEIDQYFVKDTVIGKNNFVLLISKKAPGTDVEFIKTNIEKL